ncbi:MAG TPA: DUF2147 domain-containing protein [Methylosinus sp.]|jgi:uncharacterized protein (DUF2147 family)
MKTASITFLGCLTAASPALAGAGDPIYGVWVRDGHNQKLEFFDCEGHLCARGVFPPPPPGAQPALILRYAARIEPNKWKGDLFNPENGKTYSGMITLDSPTRLTLTGCLIAFLCQSEGWTKIPVEVPSQKTPTPRRRVNNP